MTKQEIDKQNAALYKWNDVLMTQTQVSAEELVAAKVTTVEIDQQSAGEPGDDGDERWNVPVWITFKTPSGYEDRIWGFAGVRDSNIGSSQAAGHPIAYDIWVEGNSRSVWCPDAVIAALRVQDEDGDEDEQSTGYALLDWFRDVIEPEATDRALAVWREWRDAAR